MKVLKWKAYPMQQKRTNLIQRLAFAMLAAVLAGAVAVAEGGPGFQVRFTTEVSDQPYTGRVYVMTTRSAGDSPLDGPDWFDPAPFFAVDVERLSPGQSVTLSARNALGHPFRIDQLPAGDYWVQAVIDLNGQRRNAIKAPGNAHSPVVRFTHDPSAPHEIELEIAQRIPEREYKNTDRLRYVFLRSELLSRFHRREVMLKAAVALPESYQDDETRRYPTLYEIPGFGGNIDSARWFAGFDPYMPAGLEIVRVLLDPEAPTGHHTFADSDNNGPVGTALVTELIPHLEREFRLIRDPETRYLTGASSGGWSSLWLQITYPDAFGGVWSLCPDPVDFRAFQNCDIYAERANMYFNPDGSLIECSRPGSMGHIMVKGMNDMETVVGRGGQYQSFEAVFSPRGPDGRPLQLWDRESGAVNPRVAESWRRYDITHILRTRWNDLAPKLSNKLHVICGDEDTFFLEKAVFLLRDELKKLDSDARVTIIPGGTHFLGPAVSQQAAREIAAAFSAWQARRSHDAEP